MFGSVWHVVMVERKVISSGGLSIICEYLIFFHNHKYLFSLWGGCLLLLLIYIYLKNLWTLSFGIASEDVMKDGKSDSTTLLPHIIH